MYDGKTIQTEIDVAVPLGPRYIEGVGYGRTHTHTTSFLADGSNV